MKIICLGDSLTAGYNLRREENWVELLNRETPDQWLNAGVSGDTSTGLVARLSAEVLPQRPDEVLFMGGDNDILLTGSADQAKSAVMAMIHQCAARGVRPVVGIAFPLLDVPEVWRLAAGQPGNAPAGAVAAPIGAGAVAAACGFCRCL